MRGNTVYRYLQTVLMGQLTSWTKQVKQTLKTLVSFSRKPLKRAFVIQSIESKAQPQHSLFWQSNGRFRLWKGLLTKTICLPNWIVELTNLPAIWAVYCVLVSLHLLHIAKKIIVMPKIPCCFFSFQTKTENASNFFIRQDCHLNWIWIEYL